MVDGVNSILILEKVVFIFVLLLKFEVLASSHDAAESVVQVAVLGWGSSRADRDWKIIGNSIIGGSHMVCRFELITFGEWLQQIVTYSATAFSR